MPSPLDAFIEAPPLQARAQLGSRDLFPNVEARAFLNFAAIGPTSTPVIESVNEVLRDFSVRGSNAIPYWFGRRNALRAQLARLINAPDAQDVALVTSTTQGVIDIAFSLPWERGDGVGDAELQRKSARPPREKWEDYWRNLATTVGEVLWDTPPSEDTGKLLTLCEGELDRGLQIVDLACGNGRRSLYLAERFPKVVGVDVSAEAIRGAKQLYKAPNLEFRVLDATEPDTAKKLHDEIGDAHVHVSGMFHSLKPDERKLAAQTVAHLAGKRGRALIEEIGTEAEKQNKMATLGGAPPIKLQEVWRHGIMQTELRQGELAGLLTPHGFRLVRDGVINHATTDTTPDGKPLVVPLHWWLFARS